MTGQHGNALRDGQLAFLGRLLAGLSHDFRNHLAIISESMGLMGDLMLLESDGQMAHKERYVGIMATVRDRVNQAAEMSRHLNRFAHRMEAPLASFSVNDLLEEELFLLQRLFRQKGIHPEMRLAGALPAVHANPGLVQFVLFCVLASAVDQLAEQAGLAISTESHETAVQVVVQVEGLGGQPAASEPAEPFCAEALSLALHELDAVLLRRPLTDAVEEITLKLPVAGRSS